MTPSLTHSLCGHPLTHVGSHVIASQTVHIGNAPHEFHQPANGYLVASYYHDIASFINEFELLRLWLEPIIRLVRTPRPHTHPHPSSTHHCAAAVLCCPLLSSAVLCRPLLSLDRCAPRCDAQASDPDFDVRMRLPHTLRELSVRADVGFAGTSA
jgi:hypothetical protein